MSIPFQLDPKTIEDRLRARLSRGEFTALILLIFVQWGFVYLLATYGGGSAGYDWQVFEKTTHGNYQGFYYPHWVLPIFELLVLLPAEWDFLVWGTLNVLMYWIAIRIFGGRPVIALLSYQAFYSADYGQIYGLTTLGLGLLWWGMARGRWNMAGFGGLLASTKFQIGGTLGLAIWLLAPVTWSQRLRVLILPTMIAVLSIIIDPDWPGGLLDRLQNAPPDTLGNISLWGWIGPLAALLWLPVIFLDLPMGRRVVAVAAAAGLAMPYFQQSDLVHLYMLPVGWVPLLGNLGYLLLVLQWEALRLLTIVAAVVYVWSFWPHLQSIWRHTTSRERQSEVES